MRHRSRSRNKQPDPDTQAHYAHPKASEFLSHFYLKYVYLPEDQSISDFISQIHQRIQKAGQPASIRILEHLPAYQEVHLSIGMKYDHEANRILEGYKTIFIPNKDKTLVYALPMISKAYLPHVDLDKLICNPSKPLSIDYFDCVILGVPLEWNEQCIRARLAKIINMDFPVEISKTDIENMSLFKIRLAHDESFA